jgi:integrase
MFQLFVIPYRTRNYEQPEKMICKMIYKTPRLPYAKSMGRPKNKDGIRITTRTRDGVQLVHLEEYPGHWIASPETDRDKALKWARRNRERLINRQTHDLAFYCRDFFSPDSPWVARMKKKGHHYTDKYLANRRGYVENYIVPEFGDCRPGQIRRREIDNWLLTLKKKKGSGQAELAGETKNKILYTMSLIFEELIDLEVIEANPIAGIRPYDKTPVSPRGTIDRESLGRLYPATHGELVRVWGSSMWAAMMLVFNDTGSRPGEVRALKWSDIDIRKRFIPIRKGIESGTLDTMKGTKSGAVKAGFPSVRTIQELDIWRAESRHGQDDDYVFTIDGDAPVTNEAVVKAFRRGLAFVKIDEPRWTPYWLRHSFGTYQMENLSDEEISSLMGNGVVVLRRSYQHPDDETLYLKNRGIQRKLDQAREG